MTRTLRILLSLLVVFPAVVTAQRIKLPASRKDLEKVVRDNPNDAAAHYNVALAYWNEKKWDRARTELQSAVTIEPRLAAAHLALAYMPYAQRSKLWTERFEDDLSDSLSHVLEVSRREERHAYLIDPLVDRTIIGATTPKRSALWQNNDFLRGLYQLWFQGFDDFIGRDYENAYSKYNRLLEEWSKSRISEDDAAKPPVDWIWYRALSAAQTDRFEEARAGIQQLLQRTLDEEEGPDLVQLPLRTNEYRYMAAALEQRAGNLVSALELYQKAAQHDLGLYMAHVRMADIYESRKQYPKAIKERRRAIAANPDDPTLVMDLGISLGKAGHFAEAEEYLTQASAADPRHALMPFWLGLAQMQQQKWAPARESFTRFIDMAPARYQRQVSMARQNLERIP